MKSIKTLKDRYTLKQKQIKKRLKEFRANKTKDKIKLAGELSFCIFAANSSAKSAFRAQRKLEENDLLFSKSQDKISKILLESHVRFHNNKARYFILARDKLLDKNNLEKYIESAKNQFELRNMLAKNILGLGMKEAGHFMRNTAIGFEVAILDRHVLKNLYLYGAINQIPDTLGINRYKEIEKKMIVFSKKLDIPIQELDLLFWSEQTGEIFK